MIVKSTAGPVPTSESNDSASPPPYEAAIAGSVNHLHRSMTTYQEAVQQGREPTEPEAQKVADAMRDVGDTHRDPKVRTDWHRRAEKFLRAPKAGREGILRESGGIVRALLSIPLALLGTALHIAGGAIHAVGSVLGGIGDVVMGSSRDGAGHAPHAPHAEFGRARFSRTQNDLNAGSLRDGAPHQGRAALGHARFGRKDEDLNGESKARE
ncbi:hypothetical protein FPV67DRAFT_507439 [Lyophyllum atratum]|nr:hypothetical protein FPV67DRAFT_507439 [Lyophyllum atratum]